MSQIVNVTPGLIDLQVNGGPGCSFWTVPKKASVIELCNQLLRGGVTSFLPTLITNDVDEILKTVKFLQSLGVGQHGIESANFGVVPECPIRMPGIHLEGPCISS